MLVLFAFSSRFITQEKLDTKSADKDTIISVFAFLVYHLRVV